MESELSIKSKKRLQKTLMVSWKLLRFVLLFGLAYIIIYPLLYMISMSLRNVVDLYDVSVTWLPKHLTLENFKRVTEAIDYPAALFNTVLISTVTSVVLVITCSMTAYGLSRCKFRGREAIFAMVLLTIIVPQQFFVLTTYLNLRFYNLFGILSLVSFVTGETTHVSLIDTPLTFLLPALFGIGIRSGLYIYIFRQFFKGMPKELEEAAAIDGCGTIKTFVKIVVPTAMPAFVTTFLFSFVWHWNDYQFSTVFMVKMKTLSGYLVNIVGYIYEARSAGGAVGVDTNQQLLDIQTGCVLVVIPVVILYIFLQRFFTESIERTGLVE